MTEAMRKILQHCRDNGDFDAVIDAVPYAGLLGIKLHAMDLQPTFILPANKDNIGNPMLPAIHGGGDCGVHGNLSGAAPADDHGKYCSA